MSYKLYKINFFLKNDIVQRMIITFIEGFLTSIIVRLNSTTSYDVTLIKSVFFGAIASGISAVLNLALKLINEWKKK